MCRRMCGLFDTQILCCKPTALPKQRNLCKPACPKGKMNVYHTGFNICNKATFDVSSPSTPSASMAQSTSITAGNKASWWTQTKSSATRQSSKSGGGGPVRPHRPLRVSHHRVKGPDRRAQRHIWHCAG